MCCEMNLKRTKKNQGKHFQSMSKTMGLMKNWPASGNCDQSLTKVPQSCCIRRHHSSNGHTRLCRTSVTVGIVRAPSPGAWEEGETLLMSLLQDSSPLSQLQVLDDVRERHIQGRASPGPMVLVHHIIYSTIFLLLLILLKAIQNGFNPTESNYRMVWDGREL